MPVGKIEIGRHMVIRAALENDLFDSIAVAVQRTDDPWFKRCTFR